MAQQTFHLYVVGHYFDTATFAIYAVGCLQIPLVDMMMTSTSSVMMVRMKELRTERERDEIVELWRDTTVKLSLILVPIMGGVLVVAYQLITLLYTSRYAASVPVFMISVLEIGMAPIMIDAVLRVYAEMRFRVIINLAKLAVVAGTITVLMWWLGIVGAITSTLLGSVTFKVLGMMRVRRLFECPVSRVLPWNALARILLIVAIAVGVALIVKLGVQQAGANRLVTLIAVAVVYGFVYAALFFAYAPLSDADKRGVVAWVLTPLVNVIGMTRRRVAVPRDEAGGGA